MSEWTIVTVIIALAGLIVTVTTPLLKLNSTMTRVSERLDAVMRDMADLKESDAEIRQYANESHQRLHDRIDENGKHIQDHEKRIVRLETMK